MHGRFYLWQINQEMEVKFPVVFVVFCFVLYGHHMQVLIFTQARACVYVKRVIFWISSLKQGQKSGSHANFGLVSHEEIRIFVLRNISTTPSLHTRRRVQNQDADGAINVSRLD